MCFLDEQPKRILDISGNFIQFFGLYCKMTGIGIEYFRTTFYKKMLSLRMNNESINRSECKYIICLQFLSKKIRYYN